MKITVGAYGEFVAARPNPGSLTGEMQQRFRNLAVNYVTAQWVSAADAKAAEASFFKINQAATPIDATERRILMARKSPNAIAARSITRAGTGHKYWSDFVGERQGKIESLGKRIYIALYEPPMSEGPIKTLDLPMAGRGYNALPFVFDLVNQSNGVKIADSTKSKIIEKDQLPEDEDGTKTVAFLERVSYFIDRITGTSASCIGPHPAVYFYTRSGTFQPSAFLAFAKLIEWLEKERKLNKLTEGRKELEDFLIRNKGHIGLIVHKYGSGVRSVTPILNYFKAILTHAWNGKEGNDIEAGLESEQNFAFLFAPKPTDYRASTAEGGKDFGKATKSAAFMEQALASVSVCLLCGGRLHRNSMQVDHITKRQDGGGGDMRNARMTHPYCNSNRG